jgi:hypothetical protein
MAFAAAQSARAREIEPRIAREDHTISVANKKAGRVSGRSQFGGSQISQNRKRTPAVVARLLRAISPLAMPPNAAE